MLDAHRSRTIASYLTDPRGYNIRWLELLHELKPIVDSFASGPMRALITGGGGQLASDLAALLGDEARAFSHARARHHRHRGARSRVCARWSPTSSSTARRFTTSTSASVERGRAWQVNVEAVRELALPQPAARARLDQLRVRRHAEEPYGETDLPSPRSIYALTKLAGEYAALALCAARARRAHRRVSTGCTAARARAATSSSGCSPALASRARCGWCPTSACSRRSPPTSRPAILAACRAPVRPGVVHLTASGARARGMSSRRRSWPAPDIEVPIEPCARP